MSTIITTTADFTDADTLGVPAFASTPAGATHHATTRLNSLSLINRVDDSALTEPNGITYAADRANVGAFAQLATGFTPANDSDFTISVVVYIDPSTGADVPIIGNHVGIGLSHKGISLTYKPGQGSGEIQVRGYAQGTDLSIVIPFPTTNAAGWYNFMIFHRGSSGTKRIYYAHNKPDGTIQSNASTSGAFFSGDTLREFKIGGEITGADSTPFAVADFYVLPSAREFVFEDPLVQADLDANAARMATVGITLPSST